MYQKYEGKGSNTLFELTDDEAKRYNELVDLLNSDISRLEEYKNSIKEANGNIADYEVDVILASDPVYKEMYKQHSEYYDEYMEIQNVAIQRTNRREEYER